MLCPSIDNNPVPSAVERDTTVLGVFLCDLQFSMSIFVREVKVIQLSLSLIKTFSFSCFCVHVTFRFTSLPSVVDFSFAFLDISIFSPLWFFYDKLILALRFYFCMELNVKPELLKYIQVLNELLMVFLFSNRQTKSSVNRHCRCFCILETERTGSGECLLCY